jgi:hypothetical protein
VIDWQPIETAPQDEYCLVTDGVFFAAGKQYIFPSPELRQKFYPDIEPHLVWSLNGCSSFADENAVEVDWDHNITDFEPTHWAEPFILPTAQKVVAKTLDTVVCN